jgi:hypothetical protein
MGMLLALAADRVNEGVVEVSVSSRHTSTTATAATVVAKTAVATTASIASHLGKARIDLLLCLLEDVHQVSSLLVV